MVDSLLSVVVVCYNMQREAPRTLYSLSTKYQQDVDEHDYEVIVIDNNSETPLGSSTVESFGSNFRYSYLDSGSKSPVDAVNLGVSCARGDSIGILIDGARIASPGLVRDALSSLRLFDRSFVSTLSWHLGSEVQFVSVPKGYSRQEEDRLLNSIDWRRDGYRLFEISCFSRSCQNGFFRPISESNAVFCSRKYYELIGGYDGRFNLPGGGYANHDFYKRGVDSTEGGHVILLGEGTFHQHHGGITTSSRSDDVRTLLKSFRDQYKALRGQPYSAPYSEPYYYGPIRNRVLPFIKQSLDHATAC